jgi:hypothetical protein
MCSLLQAAVYDYMLMSLVPLIFVRDLRMWWLLGLTWCLMGVVTQLPAAEAAIDWGYNALSVVLVVYLAVALALRTFIWREPDGPCLAGTDA